MNRIWIVEPATYFYDSPRSSHSRVIPCMSDFILGNDKKFHRCNHVVWENWTEQIASKLADCIHSKCDFDPILASEDDYRHIKATLKMHEAIYGMKFGRVYIQRKLAVNNPKNCFTKNDLKIFFEKLI